MKFAIMGKILNYGWTFESRVNFWIFGEKLNHGWNFESWVNFLNMNKFLYWLQKNLSWVQFFLSNLLASFVIFTFLSNIFFSLTFLTTSFLTIFPLPSSSANITSAFPGFPSTSTFWFKSALQSCVQSFKTWSFSFFVSKSFLFPCVFSWTLGSSPQTSTVR